MLWVPMTRVLEHSTQPPTLTSPHCARQDTSTAFTNSLHLDPQLVPPDLHVHKEFIILPTTNTPVHPAPFPGILSLTMAYYYWGLEAHNLSHLCPPALAFHVYSQVQISWPVVRALKMALTKVLNWITHVSGLQHYLAYCNQVSITIKRKRFLIFLLFDSSATCLFLPENFYWAKIWRNKPLSDELLWLMHCEQIILNAMKTFECKCLCVTTLLLKPVGFPWAVPIMSRVSELLCLSLIPGTKVMWSLQYFFSAIQGLPSNPCHSLFDYLHHISKTKLTSIAFESIPFSISCTLVDLSTRA